jgi:two-component system alkaline phosphatase synthesis response regulator PhoP
VPLSDRLRREGYSVQVAVDGQTGFEQALQDPFDLILLDLMLPGKGGLDICRDLRQQGLTTPILMLTARVQTYDKVLGLKIGADDYVPKPFEVVELLARIEALLRRAMAPRETAGAVRHFGSVRVDLRRAQVSRNGRAVSLTAREFRLLRYFVDHSGALLTRQELLREVWELDPSTSTRTVDVHVGWLRQKLEDDPRHPSLITTVTGLGYRFSG